MRTSASQPAGFAFVQECLHAFLAFGAGADIGNAGHRLGDQRLDGTTVTTEWRTPPLWGIGLLDTVSGHATLLHDGRARDYEEAILWHDGEAAASAAAYRALSAADRAALVRFLESL